MYPIYRYEYCVHLVDSTIDRSRVPRWPNRRGARMFRFRGLELRITILPVVLLVYWNVESSGQSRAIQSTNAVGSLENPSKGVIGRAEPVVTPSPCKTVQLYMYKSVMRSHSAGENDRARRRSVRASDVAALKDVVLIGTGFASWHL